MCIVIYAPAGVVVPESHFENSFLGNSDGAGIMYNNKEDVIIKKGFMNYDDFIKYAVTLPEDCDRVYHFRIATAGKVSKEVCHPYPVVNNVKKMMCTDVVCDIGAAHNGIISWCTPVKQLKSSTSDSMIFLSSYVYPHRNTVFKSESFREILSHASGGKFAFMNKNTVKLIGNFIEDNGVFYSNSTYKNPPAYAYYRDSGTYNYYYDSWEDGVESGKFPNYYGKNFYKESTKLLKNEYGVPVEEVAAERDKEGYSKVVESLFEGGVSDNSVAIIKFTPADYPDLSLDYDDIDLLLQALTYELGIVVYNFEYDFRENAVYIVTEWDQITVLPAIVDGLTWKVV